MPKVTVIIPNYNHEKYLPWRIDSVLQQTYQDFEIILLDDCSPDNSRKIIAGYQALDVRIQVVINEKNSGSTFKQWNKGFALAKGKYIWIAESDDFAAPSFLEVLVDKLESNPAIGLAYCHSHTVDEENNEINALGGFYTQLDTQLWEKDFVVDGRYLITNFMSYRNVIPNASAVVVRKSVIDKVGKANESFKINGDWIFWASIIADVKVAFVAQKLNYFRFHLNNVRSKTLVKGVALHEMTKVMREMQQYGEPNSFFLHEAVYAIAEEWLKGMMLNVIPLKTQLEIYRNLKAVDSDFNQRFLALFRRQFLSNNFSGTRQFLGDGLLYKYLKKKSVKTN